MCLFQFWFSQDICLRVGLLCHMVVLFLVFKGISIPSSTVVVSIYVPTSSARAFLFSTHFPAFIACRLFDDGYSDQCEMIPHCSLDLHFSSNKQCQGSVHIPVDYLYGFFGEMFIQIFYPFFYCTSCLYILEINPLLVTSFANIFSHSVGCLLNSFSLNKSYIFSSCHLSLICTKYLVLNRMTDMLLKMTMFDVWTDSNDILRIFFPCIKGRTTTVFTLKFSPV